MQPIENFKSGAEEVKAHLQREYSSLHTGKASPQVLDGIHVDSYGSMMPVKNVSSISIEDARTLRVAPWDKNMIKAIEKAITEADIGLSVSSDDMGLRVIFPMLTTETRSKLVKILKDRLEDARVSIRKEREKANKDIDEMEKGGGMSEDDKFKAKENLQKAVDSANEELESMFRKKETEVMSI